MTLEIFAYKCKKCGQIHYPYRMVCKKCKANEHNEFDPVPLPKKGKLLTYTHLYTLPGDFEVTYLALGIVELENGLRITGQLKLPKPKIGMAVRGEVEVVRRGDFSKNYGMVFYPA
ncbi:MAG: OB-fold domain-containing protein [Lentisphaerota bacterium]